MNFLKAISITFLVSALSASAAPQFAIVRIKDIYTALPSTAAIQQQIKNDHAEIMKNQRAEQLGKIIGELQALQAQFSDKTTPLDEAANRNLTKTYEIKRQEALTLQQEFDTFKAEQEKIINRKMASAMRASLDRIEAASAKISKERGYDAVFNSSGDTNTGIPFVLFNKKAPDLTLDIQAAMKNASEPVTDANQSVVPESSDKPTP